MPGMFQHVRDLSRSSRIGYYVEICRKKVPFVDSVVIMQSDLVLLQLYCLKFQLNEF